MTPDQRDAECPSSSPPRRCPLLSLGVASALIVGIGTGAYAVFTAADRVPVGIRAGEVELEWGATGTDQTSIPVTGLLPGRSTQRLANLTNTGSIALSSIQLTSTTTQRSSDSDGLQMEIEACSVPWTPSGNTFTCPGATTVVSADRPASGRVTFETADSRTPGGTDRLRFTFRLSTSSPTSAQSAVSSLQLSALGVQVSGQHH